MNSAPDLSLIIACYNETDILTNSVKEVVEILDATRYTYEFIFIDDCSQDDTRELIDALIEQYADKSFRRIFHEQNKGRGGTVTDGIREARGTVVGFIDIDLETHARYIPSCVAEIQKGYDIATAQRIYTFQFRSFDRYILSKGYSRLVKWIFGFPLQDTETGFKFFNRENILPVLDTVQDQRWFWDTEIMARSYLSGLKIIEIPSLFTRRFDKVSTVNPLSDSFEYLVQLYRFKKQIKQEQNRFESIKRNTTS